MKLELSRLGTFKNPLFSIFSNVIDSTKKSIELIGNLDLITINNIGQRQGMSKSDILSLNKAYSCKGTVSTYGGGNFQVFFLGTYFIKPFISMSLYFLNSLCRPKAW